jgi:PKD repeat protein
MDARFRYFRTILSWLLLVLFGSCQQEKPKVNDPVANIVKAEFDYSIPSYCLNSELRVAFINKSENAVSYRWDFGDSTSSTLENPTKIYNRYGAYEVKLTAYPVDKESTFIKSLFVPQNFTANGPLVNFISKRGNNSSLEYSFTGILANATDYRWFDSGWFPATTPNDTVQITHIFSGPGQYQIILYARNDFGINCYSQSVYVNP